MNKANKYGAGLGLAGGIRNGILNLIEQSKRDTKQQFNFKSFLAEVSKGAVMGAAGGYIIGSIEDYYNSLEKQKNTDFLLWMLAEKIRLNKNDPGYIALNKKAEWLIGILKSEFQYKLKSDPIRFGSTEMGTALKKSADVDICVAFKHNSFSSTKEMFFAVEEVLKKYKGINGFVRTRQQDKSIGVYFYVNGNERKIDVLPNKITRTKGNTSSGYIYINGRGLFDKSSYTKTDIQLLKSIKLSETQKKLLITLKNWKFKRNVPISSHLLLHLILDTYQCNTGMLPERFTEKLVLVLKHIEKYFDCMVITSVENTNNVLTDIPETDKTEIINACHKVIERYDYQPNTILEIFI